MTKYRIIHDGEVEWLQYLYEYKWIWFKRQKWTRVRSDRWEYYDEQWEMHNNRYGNRHSDWQISFRYVNSSRDNLEAFVEKWPNIENWYLHRNYVVGEMKRIYYEQNIKRQEERERLKGKIKYL